MADQIRNDLPKAAVLYFDRVSSGSLLLARHYRDAGALIVFEPSSAGDEKLVKKAIALAHIVKYSRQRLSGLTEALGDIFVPLEIETLGREGLRFRRRRTAQDTAQWQSLPAYEVPDLLDEAGSGDWCTAGILHSLARHGAASFSRSRDPGLARAFTLGQALAAANCSFPGARGAMYELSLNEFAEAVQKATKGQPLTHNREPTNASEIHCLLEALCTHCRPPLAKFQS